MLGFFSSISELPNAPGNPVSGAAFANFEVMDDAYLPDGRYRCYNKGDEGAGNAQWSLHASKRYMPKNIREQLEQL